MLRQRQWYASETIVMTLESSPPGWSHMTMLFSHVIFRGGSKIDFTASQNFALRLNECLRVCGVDFPVSKPSQNTLFCFRIDLMNYYAWQGQGISLGKSWDKDNIVIQIMFRCQYCSLQTLVMVGYKLLTSCKCKSLPVHTACMHCSAQCQCACAGHLHCPVIVSVPCQWPHDTE